MTPSYQAPLGVALTLERRLALLDWASRAEAWVLEDDYNGEYRYDTDPIPAVQALDRAGRVIYVGSFSKTRARVARGLSGAAAVTRRGGAARAPRERHEHVGG